MVEGEARPPNTPELDAETAKVGTIVRALDVSCLIVNFVQCHGGQFGKEQQSAGSEVRGKDHALAGADPECLRTLDTRYEPDGVAGADRKVGRLVYGIDQSS